MNSSNTLQDVFFSAAGMMEQELSSELDNNAMPLHHFSHRYQRRKRKILAGQNLNLPVPRFRGRLVFVLISILSLFACAMGVPEIRKPIVSFIERVFLNMTIYEIDTEKGDIPDYNQTQENFTLNYIPEGFELKDTLIDNEINIEIYQNASDHSFSVTVMPYDQGNIFSYDTEDATVTRTEIQGNYTVISQKGTSINIVVFNDNQNKIYNLIGNIDADAAIKILENINTQ